MKSPHPTALGHPFFKRFNLFAAIIAFFLAAIYLFDFEKGSPLAGLYTYGQVFFLLIFLVSGVGFSLCWKFGDVEKNIALFLLATSTSLFLFLSEAFLRFHYTDPPPMKRMDRLEILKKDGVNAFPFINPIQYSLEHGLLPMPNVLTIEGNESWSFVIYQSDENGLKNPVKLYSQNKDFKRMIIGDSLAQGYSVAMEDSWPHLMGSYFNQPLYSAAMGSTGPFQQLLIAHKILAPRAPQTIIWSFFGGNDFRDLAFEMEKFGLTKENVAAQFEHYSSKLATSDPQGLKRILEKEIRKYRESKLKDRPAKSRLQFHEKIMNRLMLVQFSRLAVRQMNAKFYGPPKIDIPKDDVQKGFSFAGLPAQDIQDIYKAILGTARQLFPDSRFVLVYIPWSKRLGAKSTGGRREFVEQQAKNLKMDFFDTTIVFQENKSPCQYFFPKGQCSGGHLTVAGNRLVAKALATYLKGQKN